MLNPGAPPLPYLPDKIECPVCHCSIEGTKEPTYHITNTIKIDAIGYKCKCGYRTYKFKEI